MKDKAGNLYGTTAYGGPNNAGTVFKLAPDGTETILYFFTGGKDGGNPQASLVKDKAGNLYSTTTQGGADGYGVVFKLAPDGTETVLHTFTGGSDGGYLYGGVIRDKMGNLYGMTEQGGTAGDGVVFEIASGGAFTVLHQFSGTDGANPADGLVTDDAGNFYGTTEYGGSVGVGTVFKLAPGGTLTVLHSFTQQSDGGAPEATPVLDDKGNLYGTAQDGGADNEGVVYEVAPNGTLTALHSFTGSSQDGGVPLASLIIGNKGDIYGTTSQGGFYGDGAIFKLAPDGSESLLFSLNGGSTGDGAEGGLIADPGNAKGYLYGTAMAGGDLGGGNVFEVGR